jgi:hypothetical protein
MDGGGGGATEDFDKLPVEDRLSHKVPFFFPSLSLDSCRSFFCTCDCTASWMELTRTVLRF